MSIIYNTLNRLEMDGPSRPDTLDMVRSSHLTGKSMQFPMKAIATAVMLVFAGTGLMTWHWNVPLNGSSGLSLANAGSQMVVGETPDHLLSPVPTEVQVSHESQPAAQNRQMATPADQPAKPLALDPAVVASDTGRQPKKARENSLQARTGEKTPAEANMRLATRETPSPKPKPELEVTHKPEQPARVVPSNTTTQSSKADEAVERARRTLARGRYQEALAVLKTLSPVPEHRVDYWLLKGSAHLGLGQLDPAEEALTSAQLLAPANAQIAVQWAILKQEKGDHASALHILEGVATRHPDVPEVFLNQGYSQLELGSVRDARRSFHVFLRITEGRSLYAEQRKAVNEWLAQFSST